MCATGSDTSTLHVLKADFPKGDEPIEEWRNHLAAIGELDGDAGHTNVELAEQLGIPRRSMRTILSRGVENGQYVVGTGIRPNARGQRAKVPVYRLVKPRRAKRSKA